MSRFQFVKPSMKRLIWSIIAATVLSCVVAGVCLFVSAHIVSRNDPDPTTTGDWIRLLIWFIVLWGPSLLMIVWFVTIPVVVALGVLLACVRNTPSGESSPTSRSSVG